MKNLINKIIKFTLESYDTYISFTFLGRFISFIESCKKIKITNSESYEIEFYNSSSINGDFLIGTKPKGLFLFSRNKLIHLISNLDFYGITKHGNRYFAFHKTGLHGQIISFKIENHILVELKKIITGLSKGVHQIDFIGSKLFVTNTYQNSILTYSIEKLDQAIHWSNYDDIIYPNGELNKGRKSKNYSHFNSVYSYKKKLYIVAHNETRKTGINSQIYVLDMSNQFELIEKLSINGSNCHNIYIDNELMIYCKSLECKVSVNNKEIELKNSLTRGISISKDYYVLGGSDIELKREKRNNTSGRIEFYDKKLNLINGLKINRTQIQEIRRVDEIENTYSNVIEKIH